MLKAIRLFLLKRKIGYKYKWDSESCCLLCIAYRKDELGATYCDRFKFRLYADDICYHFVPNKQIELPIPTPRQIIGYAKAQEDLFAIFDGLMGMVNKLGRIK